MIADNLIKIQEQIANCAKRAGRKPESIKLVAVSKRFPVQDMLEAFGAGQIYFGENYIQEVQEKRSLLPEEARIHFIGHLQSNKARTAVETCQTVETVDSLKLAKLLNKFASAAGRTLDILIQVNIGEDKAKAGVQDCDAEPLLMELQALSHIKTRGVMTMPPFTAAPELSRPHFANLRNLAHKMARKRLFDGGNDPEISMGMSNDFHVAIEEGATIVRVGTAIFGNRPSFR